MHFRRKAWRINEETRHLIRQVRNQVLYIVPMRSELGSGDVCFVRVISVISGVLTTKIEDLFLNLLLIYFIGNIQSALLYV